MWLQKHVFVFIYVCMCVFDSKGQEMGGAECGGPEGIYYEATGRSGGHRQRKET